MEAEAYLAFFLAAALIIIVPGPTKHAEWRWKRSFVPRRDKLPDQGVCCERHKPQGTSILRGSIPSSRGPAACLLAAAYGICRHIPGAVHCGGNPACGYWTKTWTGPVKRSERKPFKQDIWNSHDWRGGLDGVQAERDPTNKSLKWSPLRTLCVGHRLAWRRVRTVASRHGTSRMDS
jgi:hypothetical protein